MRKTKLSILAAACLGLTSVALSVASRAAEITGAGASLPAPIYVKWADAYGKSTGNKVNYQSIGSGGGVKQIASKTVDFGASDMPLTPQDLAKQGMMQFPTVIGGVVPIVNIAGLKPGELKLTGPLLADIFLGKVTKWNDKSIKSLNSSLSLPDQDIVVVSRADGSGTSFIFTNYLSKISPEWKTKVGESTAPQWPIGLSGKGDEGVSAYVQRLPGSIGFVEFAYAKQSKLVYTSLQNRDKQFVQPDDMAFKSAAATADWSNSFYEILTDESGKDTWPITGATFVMVQKVQDKPVQGTETLKFFDWSYKNGAKMASDMDYVPLPDSTLRLIYDAWGQIKDASGKALYAEK